MNGPEAAGFFCLLLAMCASGIGLVYSVCRFIRDTR